MLRFFASCISAVLLFGSAPQASADILQATFVGTYRGHVNGTFLYFGGQSPQSVPYSALLDDPYVAAFLFDTTLGTLSSPSPGIMQLQSIPNSLSPALSVSVVITDAVLGSVGTTASFNSTALLSWQFDSLGDAAILQAFAINDFGSIGFDSNLPPFGEDGFFQHGTCPGLPCGFLDVTSSTLTDLSGPLSALSVPAPVIGTGLPGLMFASGALLAWRHRKRKQTA